MPFSLMSESTESRMSLTSEVSLSMQPADIMYFSSSPESEVRVRRNLMDGYGIFLCPNIVDMRIPAAVLNSSQNFVETREAVLPSMFRGISGP